MPQHIRGGRVAKVDTTQRKQLASKFARGIALDAWCNPTLHTVPVGDLNGEVKKKVDQVDEKYGEDHLLPLELVNVDDLVNVTQLQTYLKDALDFINKCPNPPKSLVPLLLSRANIAEDRSDIQRESIFEIYRDLSNKILDRTVLVFSDDLSAAMVKFVPEVEALARLPGTESLKYAYDAALQLKESSYGDLDEGPGYSDGRPSDVPVDKLLEKLVQRRVAAGQVWDWEAHLDCLVKEAKSVDAFGIVKNVDWYPRTCRALRKVVEEKVVSGNA